MRFGWPISIAYFLVVQPVFAQNQEVKRSSVPDWAQPSELLPVPETATGAIFVRRQDVLIHLDKTGEQHHTSFRIKILDPSALALGNLSISWNPVSGAPLVHAIKIHRDGDVVDLLKDSKFEVLRRENELEAAKLSGLLTAVLRISDLRVSDELEFSFTIPQNDPTLGSNSSGLLFVAGEPSNGRYRLGLSWDGGQKPKIAMTEDMAAVARETSQSIEFLFDNPPLIMPPKDAPPRYNWQRITQYSDFPDWQSVSRHFAPLYKEASRLGNASPLKAEASRIAAKYQTPLERAKAALKLVQNDIRYIYVGLDGGNYKPVSADETWQLRYGDCKGKTALLIALLAELGIESEAVLVNNNGYDDGTKDRLPSPFLFDHVLVRAKIDGATYWLDGTLPAIVPPQTEPLLPYRSALPLLDSGAALETFEWKTPTRPDEINLHEIDAREGFDQLATIRNTRIVRGIDGVQMHLQLSPLTKAQLTNSLRQQMIGDTWQSIDDVQWRYDQKAQASILTIIGKGIVEWENDGGGAKSFSLPGGGFNPPERRVRAAEQDQTAPFFSKPEYSCYVTTVRIPSSTKAANWWYNTSFDTKIFGRTYYRGFELRDNAIRMIRGSRVDQPEIDAVSAQRDNARIKSFDNSMANIYYDPSNNEIGGGNEKPVPATYELDWTADDVPCLPTSKGG